ncbi:hypothetical protein HDK64DRAFT_250797 [Phyllosticta capitalensis]
MGKVHMRWTGTHSLARLGVTFASSLACLKRWAHHQHERRPAQTCLIARSTPSPLDKRPTSAPEDANLIVKPNRLQNCHGAPTNASAPLDRRVEVSRLLEQSSSSSSVSIPSINSITVRQPLTSLPVETTAIFLRSRLQPRVQAHPTTSAVPSKADQAALAHNLGYSPAALCSIIEST